MTASEYPRDWSIMSATCGIHDVVFHDHSVKQDELKRVKCEYCGSMIDARRVTCTQCGAPLPAWSYKR